ncbi:MAG: rhomboid family intramembrane serine protease [Flavobacteriales bacterium]
MKKRESIFTGMGIPFILVFFIWCIHFLNLEFPELHFTEYGVYPQKISGLRGVLFSPFIHDTSDFSHIIGNSIPLFVLSWFFILSYRKLFFPVTVFIWLFSGVCVWLAGRESYHIGASGVIYGLAYFLFFSGVFSKNKRQIATSLIIAFSYGSMAWGIFPLEEKISWEGHLFGAISGIIMAIYYRQKYFSPDKYNLKVDPAFEEYVEEYNAQLKLIKEEEEEQTQNHSTNTTLDEKYTIFFEYLRKEE